MRQQNEDLLIQSIICFKMFQEESGWVMKVLTTYCELSDENLVGGLLSARYTEAVGGPHGVLSQHLSIKWTHGNQNAKWNLRGSWNEVSRIIIREHISWKHSFYPDANFEDMVDNLRFCWTHIISPEIFHKAQTLFLVLLFTYSASLSDGNLVDGLLPLGLSTNRNVPL